MTWRKKLQNLSASLFCPHWSGDSSLSVCGSVGECQWAVCVLWTYTARCRPQMSNLEGVEWSKWEMLLSVLLEGYAHWMGSTVVSGTVMSISSPLTSLLMCYRTVIMQANRLGLLQYRVNGGHFKAGGDARSKVEVNIRSNCSEHDLSTHPGIPSGPVAFLLLTLLRALLSPQCQQCSHDCRCCWPQILFKYSTWELSTSAKLCNLPQ